LKLVKEKNHNCFSYLLEVQKVMLINFVISKDLNSGILRDIYQRYTDYPSDELSIVISEQPVEQADIYHYHRPHLETKLVSPAVVTVHHDPEDIDHWLEPSKFETRYREAEMVVCLNSLQVDFYRDRGIEHTCVIPHGYDTKILYNEIPKTYQPGRKLKLGIISKRYDRRFKGEVYLNELMLRLDTERFSFIFVGAGRTEDELEARALGFEAEVFEYLPYRMFGNLYQSMDFLLMVSNYEGGPANLPEAVASGTPMLCTKVGMAADMVLDGVNGFLLSGNIEQDMTLFNKIAINEERIVENLFQGSIQQKRTAISWEEVIEKHIELYQSIIAQRQQSQSYNELALV
jgi:glycosyltransferase involved in cell wall biosynthesis